MTLLLPLLLSLCCQGDETYEFTVSPSGKDTDPGTKQAPFATLGKARDALRNTPGAYERRITLRGGTYFLTEPLVLNSKDGSANWTAAPGETVVISGGRLLTGWKKGNDGVWTTQVPDGLRFNQLFIDGKRRTRARSPNTGEFFRVDGSLTQDKPTRLKYKEGDLKPEWAARGDVEVIALQKWAELRMPITAVDAGSRTATLAGDCAKWIIEDHARY